MGKKNIFLLFIIIILSFLLRIWCLDKLQGLWNDEYISWIIASQKFPTEMFQEIIKNCHMPFYYLYLKLWIFCFSDNDFILRLSSVFTGILSVLIMFFVGKEYKDEKLGLLCALCASVSGFLIYFSQEVRLYSLLFLLTAINLFTLIRLLKKQSIKNFILFSITNILIILTHTIGFVFVFFNILFSAIYLIQIDKKYLKYVMWMSFLVLISMLPLIPFVLSIFRESYASQFWSNFSFGKIFFVLADYFSPIQINIITTPQNIADVVLRNSRLNIMYFIFAIIPMTLGLVGVIKSILTNEKISRYIAAISCSFFIVLMISSMSGKLVLATKYSVEIYPTLILLMCVGFLSFEKAYIRKFIAILFVLLSLTHIVINKNSAPKLGRSEGNKLVADLINRANLQKTDMIVLTYYSTDRFLKYFPVKDYKRFYYIDKYNFTNFFDAQGKSYKYVMLNGKELFYDTFKYNNNNFFDNKFYDYYIKSLHKGDKLAIILLKNVCFIDKTKMTEVTSNTKEYKNMPLMFLVFSYIKNNAIDLASKKLKPEAIYEAGDWVMVVFKKV